MSTEKQILHTLQLIEEAMREIDLWQDHPPKAEAFESVEPFSIDTMLAAEWLQWVLIPRMYVLLEQRLALPTAFAIAPYFEESYKEETTGRYQQLLEHLHVLDRLFIQDNA
ncbi:YqcC family protein [Photorhabdus heterorhabditis]|uniref:YqcC family protein n=1 Tax=Photorhabdus heterorhabditis TaxID=880156 RepID=UPI001562887B|nr:YqcC family protein [Photorhabdus heterorhabditis]NRN29451.1 YqcC family protein [Photorhabdus heterorhabditis subsp. aluminescens]